MTVRIGYACINLSLQKADKTISVNKTCRFQTIVSEPTPEARYQFLTNKAMSNLVNLEKVIIWHAQTGHRFYRLSSDMFPHISNKDLFQIMSEEQVMSYRSLNFAADILRKIGQLAKDQDIRLTMHPGQFNQLGSPHEHVVENTIVDLTWQTRLLDLLGTDFNSILCIHGGGVYGDKVSALARWRQRFLSLPRQIQQRIALENCEKGYSAQDLLPLCEELNIPFILDFFHWQCYFYYHPTETQLSLAEILPRACQTWWNRELIPKFHLSEQAPNKPVGSHSDYVEIIPDELLCLAETDIRFDIMIEAKQKDLAMIYLTKKYPQFDPHWFLYQRLVKTNSLKSLKQLKLIEGEKWLIEVIDISDQIYPLALNSRNGQPTI